MKTGFHYCIFVLDFEFGAFGFVWDLDIRYSNLAKPYFPGKKAGPDREALKMGKGAQVMLQVVWP